MKARATKRTAVFNAGPLLPQTRALVSAMAAKPPSRRVLLYDALYRSLMLSGVFARLSVLYVLAGHDAQAARLNLVEPRIRPLSEVNSPTFTADEGYTGDAVSMHLSGPVWNTLSKFTQDDNHIGAWVGGGTDAAASKYSLGHTSAAVEIAIQPRSAGGIVSIANSGTACNFGASATIIGHLIGVRRASNATEGYRDGVSLATDTDASTSVSASAMAVLRNGTSYSDFLVRAVHAGAALSDTEAADLYAALNTYLTAISASP